MDTESDQFERLISAAWTKALEGDAKAIYAVGRLTDRLCKLRGLEAPMQWTDLGDDHAYHFAGWFPDRDLNPQDKGIPDVERYAAMVRHLTPAGEPCMSGVTFDSETARLLEPGKQVWTVESWEPLTLSPSLLCRACGDHGFIRGGRWARA